jgi:hypothetical protein
VSGDVNRSRWSLGLVVRAAGVAGICLSTGATLGYVAAHEKIPVRPRAQARGAIPEAPASRPTEEPVAAGSAELALLAPLQAGSTLEDFTVDRIDAVSDGSIRVVCTRGAASIQLYVALASGDAPPAPATAGHYAVYYGPSDSPDGARLSAVLARVIASNPSAAVPPGLSPFPRREPRR